MSILPPGRGGSGIDGRPAHPDDPEDSRGQHRAEPDAAPIPDRPRQRRRAQRPAPAGSDPHPDDPPTAPRDTRENDARLREGRPPHWG